jgi:hypothetical protein
MAASTIAVLASCAENNAQTKAMCPGMAKPVCIAGVVCDEDKERGCQVCRCEAPYNVPASQPPQGAPQPLPQ